jgi:spermidine synthase
VALSVILLRSLPDMLEAVAVRIASDGLGFATTTIASAVATAPLLLPTTILIGASFPIGAKILTRDPRRSGASVGRLYAWNTLGNILGAAAAGLLVLPLAGAQDGLLLTAGLNVAAGVVLALWVLRRPLPRILLPAAGVLAFALLVWPASRVDAVLSAGVMADAENRTLLHLEETKQGIVTVVEIEDRSGRWKSFDVDAINVAGTSPGLVSIQKLQGHLPLLLHSAPERVLHIGFGSGGTAHAVSTHPEVKAIHVVEINPAVPRVAASYLPEINEGVLGDPRVRLVLEDGRNFLLACEEGYDVILSDSVHPRYAGNSALYTVDYFRIARSRLRPGGLVSLWLPLYGLSEDSFKMIVASVQEVFPHVSVWYVNSNVNEFTIVIGRTSGPAIDLDRIDRALAVPSVRADLAPIAADDPLRILDYLIARGESVTRLIGQAPLHRDDRPTVEYLSARELDRTASWIRNFELLRTARPRRPRDLLSLEERPDLMDDFARLHESTTHSLDGQLYYLLAGLRQLPVAEREKMGRAAAAAFARAARVAPDEQEPWEWFGLPGDLRRDAAAEGDEGP